jgi:hypothetical protein
MPRHGTLDLTTALAGAPSGVDLDGPTWELADAQHLQINWECLDEPALELTPPALHPSIPPFVSVFASRFPDSPVGPFTIVQLRLVVRAGIRPRGLVLAAVCDSDEATAVLRRHWGYPVTRGEATLTARHDRVRASARLDGQDVIEAVVGDPEPIAGKDLMAFDNLHLVRLAAGDEPAIVQVDPEFVIHTAERGAPRLRLPDPAALGMANRIRLTNPMTGFAFRADTELRPVRFAMDPARPAIEGTRRVGVPA